MAKLTVLCALARSGKSTYAQKWIEEYGSIKNPYEDALFKELYTVTELEHRVVINADQFRLAIHGRRFSSKAEPLVNYMVDVVLDVLMQGPYHILIDECNVTESIIKKWLKLDPNAKFVYIDTPPEICKQRAYDSQQPDLAECGVIDRMEENLQKMVFGEVNGIHPNQEQFKKAIERIRSENAN